MRYKPMDRRFAEAVVASEQDAITKRAQTEMARYSSVNCPRCGSSCHAEGDVQAMLRAGTTLKFKSRCNGCGCLFDPDIGMIIELGNLGRLQPAIPLIHVEDD